MCSGAGRGDGGGGRALRMSGGDVAVAAAAAVIPDVQWCMDSIMESAMHKLVHGE